MRFGITLFLAVLIFPTIARGAEQVAVRAVVERYCVSCHDADEAKGDLNLAAVAGEGAAAHPEIWEKVVRRVAGRQRPPAGGGRAGGGAFRGGAGALPGGRGAARG